MSENVFVNFVVDQDYDVLQVVSVLESVGVKINDVEDRKIFGEVYLTKVGPLKTIQGVAAVQVVGQEVEVIQPVITSDPIVVEPEVVSEPIDLGNGNVERATTIEVEPEVIQPSIVTHKKKRY